MRETLGLTALNLFFIVLCFLTLIPILYALRVSLSGSNSLLSSGLSLLPEEFTLSNYLAVFTGEDILTWFGNSIFLAAATVAISLAVSVPAAYCFSRRRFPGRRLVLKWLVLLNSFPAILSMFAIYRLLRPLGLVNHRLGLILVYTGTMAVFSLWNMKGYFDTIPLEIEEAARMDGAGRLKILFYVTVPNIKSSLALCALLRTIDSFRLFDKVNLLTGGGPANSTATITQYLYNYGIKTFDFGLGSAGAIVMTVIVLILSSFYIKRAIK